MAEIRPLGNIAGRSPDTRIGLPPARPRRQPVDARAASRCGGVALDFPAARPMSE
jgi:hypothetical protein